MKKIRNLKQLAKHLGCDYIDCTPDELKRSISRSLYKYTASGICFSTSKDGVYVAGYCEGDVGDCREHFLKWGFTDEDFDAAVEQADKDGCDLWDATHGCDDCQTEEVDGRKPVDIMCKGCQGHGQII